MVRDTFTTAVTILDLFLEEIDRNNNKDYASGGVYFLDNDRWSLNCPTAYALILFYRWLCVVSCPHASAWSLIRANTNRLLLCIENMLYEFACSLHRFIWCEIIRKLIIIRNIDDVNLHARILWKFADSIRRTSRRGSSSEAPILLGDKGYHR